MVKTKAQKEAEKKAVGSGNGPRKPVAEDKETVKPSEETTQPETPAVSEKYKPDVPASTPQPPAETPVPPPAKPKKKLSQEERFEQMLNVIEVQGQQISALNEKLNSVADKARLQAFDDKTKENINIKKFKLWKYNGKIVKAWSDMKTNNVYKKDNKVWIEDQTTILIYEDDSHETVNYREWQAKKIQHDVLLLMDSTDPATGTRIITVEDNAGKKFVVDIRFVN